MQGIVHISSNVQANLQESNKRILDQLSSDSISGEPQISKRQKQHTVSEEDIKTSEGKLKIENLLGSSSESPILELPKGFLLVPRTKHLEGDKESEHQQQSIYEIPYDKPLFKFDSTNSKHVEIENICHNNSLVSNNELEALKVQELPSLPTGGPRIVKLQEIGLICENLQFLELFSLKQLVKFSEEQLLLPQLRSLRLVMLSRLSNQGLAQLLGCSENLEQVFLMDLQTITAAVFPSTSNQLRVLDVIECKSLETIHLMSPSLQSLSFTDGRSLVNIELSDPVSGLRCLRDLKICGCPKLSLSWLYSINVPYLKKLGLISNAPSAKAYMSVDENGFDKFVKENCHVVQDLCLDKISNISLSTVLLLVEQCRSTLTNVVLDLTCIEKPKVREALRHCHNIQDWKVEK